MANAKVGHEQKRQDPTGNKLLEKMCELLGKDAALFLPRGTMYNFLSVKVHTCPADIIFVDHTAHIMRVESAGVAFYSEVMVEPIQSKKGVFSREDLALAIAKAATAPSPYSPRPSPVCLEQTHNFGMGSVWSFEQVKTIFDMARQHQMAVHVDGARLMNAVTPT